MASSLPDAVRAARTLKQVVSIFWLRFGARMSSHLEWLAIAALLSGRIIDAAVAKRLMHELLGIDGGTDAITPVINAQVSKLAAHGKFAHKIKFQIMIDAYEHLVSLRPFGIETPIIRHNQFVALLQ